MLKSLRCPMFFYRKSVKSWVIKFVSDRGEPIFIYVYRLYDFANILNLKYDLRCDKSQYILELNIDRLWSQ